MRRYDIVSGILLILSIIDFALAAPVLVQEKRQAYVDVVHRLKDVVTVVGKRGDEELMKLVEDFFNTGIKPIESSDTHASSSSAPQGPDHGSTNVEQAPELNPASSTANPGLLVEPPSQSSVQGAWGDPPSGDQWSYEGDDELHGPMYHTPASSLYGSDNEYTEVHAPQPNPNSGSLADSYFDWNYWVPPPPGSAAPKEFGQAHDNQAEHVQQENPPPSTDSYFDSNYWFPPPPGLASPKELGQPHEDQAEHVQQPDPAPSTGSYFDWNNWIPRLPGLASSKESGQAHEDQAEHVQPPNSAPSTDSYFDLKYWFPPSPGLASPNEFGQAYEGQAEHVQPPNPAPSTDSEFDWNYWMNLKDPPPKEVDQTHDNQAGHVQQPQSTDSEFDWNYWMNLKDPPPKEIDRAHDNQAGHVQQPQSTDSEFDWNYWMNLEDPPPPRPALPKKYPGSVVHPPSPSTGPPTEPENKVVAPPPPYLDSPEVPEGGEVRGPPPSPDHELPSDHQLGFQPVDLQAAIYAAKGKAKESRRVSGTARDVGPKGVAAR